MDECYIETFSKDFMVGKLLLRFNFDRDLLNSVAEMPFQEVKAAFLKTFSPEIREKFEKETRFQKR